MLRVKNEKGRWYDNVLVLYSTNALGNRYGTSCKQIDVINSKKVACDLNFETEKPGASAPGFCVIVAT